MAGQPGFTGPWLPMASGVEVPVVPAALTLIGALVFFVFAAQALRAPRQRRRRRRPAAAPNPPPQPTPQPVEYKPAPFAIHFPGVPKHFPDVVGVGEPFEIVVSARQEDGNAPNPLITVGGDAAQASFRGGKASIRRTFQAPGDVLVRVEAKKKGETQPRRTDRTFRVVRYREEIANVFQNFRDEISRSLIPIREDATPWEIFDLVSDAAPQLPKQTLREVIACYEEAKYSNHPVTRDTYERIVRALLRLEQDSP